MIVFVKADQFTSLQPCYIVEDGVVLGFHHPIAQLTMNPRGIVVDFRNDEYGILELHPSMEPLDDHEQMQRLVRQWFVGYGQVRELDGEAFLDLEVLKDRAKAYGRLP